MNGRFFLLCLSHHHYRVFNYYYVNTKSFQQSLVYYAQLWCIELCGKNFFEIVSLLLFGPAQLLSLIIFAHTNQYLCQYVVPFWFVNTRTHTQILYCSNAPFIIWIKLLSVNETKGGLVSLAGEHLMMFILKVYCTCMISETTHSIP